MPAHGTTTPRAYSSSEVSARDIRAWTVASNTGYTIGSLWGQPRLGLQADAASGGGPGGTLKDFYPLFPKFAYFTEASINAPINVIDAFPSITIQPTRDFAVTAGVDILWRYSTRDGFYQPPGVPLVPSSANTNRFLGEQYNLHAEWQATAHINVNAVYVHFTPAGFPSPRARRVSTTSAYGRPTCFEHPKLTTYQTSGASWIRRARPQGSGGTQLPAPVAR